MKIEVGFILMNICVWKIEGPKFLEELILK